jgi:glycosidase
MTKPIRSFPILASVSLAAAFAAIGYAIVVRLPSSQPESALLSSPFQSALVNKQNIPGSHPTVASKEEIESWSGYTGKLENDILYYIFVDRFYDGDRANNTPKVNAAINGSLATTQLEQKLSDMIYDPSHRLFGLYFGGDLEGVRKKLPYLADLGITKLVISPIQEGPPGFRIRQAANLYLDNGDGSSDQTNRANLLANYHGYWIRDWFRLDPRMRSGNNPDSLETLNRLLDEAKKFGIGIILDITLHHTSLVANQQTLEAGSQVLNIFPALGEVRRRGMILANVNTKPDWYYPMCLMDYGRPTLRMLTTCQIDVGLPTLNHDNPIVKDYLLEAAKFWMRVNPGGAQVAGMRIDAIKHISPEFIRELVQLTRNINPNAIIFAEDFGGGSQSTTTYDILNSAGDISTIDFDFTDSMRYYFSGDRSWTGNRTNVEASSLGDINTQDLSTITPNWFANPAGVLTGVQNSTPLFPINYSASKSWITSLETHDAPRMRTFRHQMTDSQYAAMIAFHFVARGVPMINYGAEIGLSVPPLPRNNGLNGLGGDPYNRQMMIWPGQKGFNQYLFSTTKEYTRLRRANPVLRYGDTFFLRPTPDPWFARPLLMLRAYSKPSTQKERKKAFLYAFSPEGGTYNFRLPKGLKPAERICDIQTGQCLTNQDNKEHSIFLRPNKHRVLEITLH